jgi:AraC-like DNA-binding protein
MARRVEDAMGLRQLGFDVQNSALTPAAVGCGSESGDPPVSDPPADPGGMASPTVRSFDRMQAMSCSGRFVRPFVTVLARYPAFESKLERLKSLPADRRVDVVEANDSVSRWVETTGDADLGLKAALAIDIGGAGPLDYAMRSANSLRDSMHVATRFAWLYSEALEPELLEEGDRAVIRLSNKVPGSRATTDFTLGAWFKNHLRSQLDGEGAIECWFSYPRPADVALHEQVFAGCTLHFGASFDGFSFDISLVDRTLTSAVPLLHAVHCEHLEALTDALPEALTTSVRVRQLVASELRHGRPSATSIARKLHMSRRTLVRRLENEGTSFTLQLDELRRQLALRFVAMRTLPLVEITTLLGFSHVQGFHRAFKRWTGHTPLRYREAVLREAGATTPS